MSVTLTLDPEVKKLWPATVLGVMTWRVSVHGVNPDLFLRLLRAARPL